MTSHKNYELILHYLRHIRSYLSSHKFFSTPLVVGSPIWVDPVGISSRCLAWQYKAITENNLRAPNETPCHLWFWLTENVKTWRHPQNWKYTNVWHCCQRRTESQPNIFRKFRKIWHVVFEKCEWTTDRQDRHTDTLVAILCTHTRGEITSPWATKRHC